jgi:hypothetical protein
MRKSFRGLSKTLRELENVQEVSWTNVSNFHGYQKVQQGGRVVVNLEREKCETVVGKENINTFIFSY